MPGLKFLVSKSFLWLRANPDMIKGVQRIQMDFHSCPARTCQKLNFDTILSSKTVVWILGLNCPLSKPNMSFFIPSFPKCEHSVRKMFWVACHRSMMTLNSTGMSKSGPNLCPICPLLGKQLIAPVNSSEQDFTEKLMTKIPHFKQFS